MLLLKNCRKFGYFATKISFMTHFFSQKPAALVSAAVALLLAVVLYLFFSGRHSVWHAVPSPTTLVMEFKGWKQVEQMTGETEKSGWQALFKTDLFEKCKQDVGFVETLLEGQTELTTQMLQSRMLGAWSLHAPDSLRALLIMETGKSFDLSRALLENKKTQKIFPANFHDHTLYTVWFSKTDRMVFCQVDKILLFSRFSYLIEESLTQMEQRSSWWANRKYVKELQPDAPLHLYLQAKSLAEMMQKNLHTESVQAAELWSRNIEWLGFSWDGSQVNMVAETKGFLKRMASFGTATPGTVFSVIPDHAAVTAWVGFDGAGDFSGALENSRDDDFREYIKPWLGKGAAWVVTEPRSPGFREDQLFFFHSKDNELALKQLRAYGTQQGALRQEVYQTFEVFEFLSPAILAPVLEGKGSFPNPVCTLLGDYVVFAPTRSALEVCIDKYIVNQTLVNTPDCIQLLGQMSLDGSNAALIVNSQFFNLLSQNFLNNETHRENQKTWTGLSKTGFIGTALSTPDPGKLTGRWAAQAPTGRAVQTGIIWKTPLSAALHRAPDLLVTEEGVFIFVQDVEHQLYCLDRSGSILWRRQMEGPLLSAVQAVGTPGQSNMNFAFNTDKHIWLLDEKGKDMGRFPVELRSPATNGMLAVDFDNNLKFNYFVACANGNIYGFDHTGSALPGWNPNNGAGKIVHPIRHFQHEGKDFLAALNGVPQLLVFGRNGAPRFPPVALSGRFASPPQIEGDVKVPRIACFNTLGKVFVCNTTGSVSTLQMGKGNQKSLGIFTPLSDGERAGFVLLQGDQLRASGYESGSLKTAYSLQLPEKQDTLFAVGAGKTGLFYREKKQIYLVDGKGNVHPDFPLAGTGPFVLRPLRPGSKELMLLVGNGNQIYAYGIR